MFFKSVEKIAIAAPGVNGAMGTITPGTHDIYANYLVRQSFNVNLPPGTTIREWRDGADVPSIATAGPKEAATISFRLERLTHALLTTFLGGTTAGTLPTKYSQPAARTSIYKCMALTCTAFGGEQFYIEIPYGLMNAGLVGSPTKDAEGKVEVNVNYEILQTLDGSGDPVAPWQSWDLLDVAG